MGSRPTDWYIAFEGPIAAGKTTLAKLFADATGSAILLEPVEENDFLVDFYADRSRWRLAMQLDFLISRHRQFTAMRQRMSVVADHTYAKDRVFARTLLSGRELKLYDRIASALAEPTRAPDVVVFLDAANDVLLERIRRRGRPYETSIEGRYLDEIRAGYEQEMRAQPPRTLLREDTAHLDLASEAMLGALFDRIRREAEDRP